MTPATTGGITINPSTSGFRNQGTLRAESGITLTVTDSLDAATFSSNTLNEGTYEVLGTMRLANANIVTNAATILLDGGASSLLRHDTGTDALANFATNANGATFTIQNSRNFTRNAAFNNAGAMTINDTSTLTLSGDGTHTGSFDGTGTLSFEGGTHLLQAGSSITTSDVMFSNEADVTIQGIYNLAGSSTTVTGGDTVVNFQAGATVGNLGALSISSSGVLNLNSGDAITLTTLDLTGGTLDGADNLAPSGLFTWSGGNLRGSGNFTANGGFAFATDQTTLSLRRDFTLPAGQTGTLTGGGGENLSLDEANFTNQGIVSIEHTGDVIISGAEGTEIFTNQGSLTKMSSNGGSTIFGVTFNNSGSVIIEDGVFNMAGGGSHSGDFTVQSLGTLQFKNGTLQGSGSITGSGQVFFADGTTTIDGTYDVGETLIGTDGIALINGSTTGTLILNDSSSFLGGSGTLTVTGLTTWEDGTMGGTGTTQANGGLDLLTEETRTLTDTRTLNNAGAATWNDGGITLNAGTTFRNQSGGTLTDQMNNLRTMQGGGTFINEGTYTKTGTSTTTISTTATNSGTMNAQDGSLLLTGTVTNTGTLRAETGGDLRVTTLTSYNAGTNTLTEGTYELVRDGSGGEMHLANADIVINAATILLDGEDAATNFLRNDNGMEALANFATNAAGASFTVQNDSGNTFTRTENFDNAGTVTVGNKLPSCAFIVPLLAARSSTRGRTRRLGQAPRPFPRLPPTAGR